MSTNPAQELRDGITYVEAALRDIHDQAGDDPLTEEQSERFDEGLEWIEVARTRLEREERRERLAEAVDRGEVRAEPSQPKPFNVGKDKGDPFDLRNIQREFDSPEAARHGLVERARRVIGDDPAFETLDPEFREEAERKVRTVKPYAGYTVAEHLLRTSSPAYIRGWAKSMSPNRDLMLDGEEREAIRDANFRHMGVCEREGEPATFGTAEARAASVGTGSEGGLLVPTILDPTVIFSGDGHVNPYREIADVRSVVNDNGLTFPTSTGVTGSWDTEGSEVSDDAPVFASTQVVPYKAAVFVPGSIEVFDDVATLAETVGQMILREKDRLEEAAFATGTGTNQPTGIVTALTGGPNYTAMATNSAFAIGDVFTAQEALGAAYQRQAVWTMNNVHINDIREMGGTSYYTRTVTLDSLSLGEVLGKRVYESTTQSSTLDGDTNNNIVYGDFSNYKIVDRIGLRTEFIPHLFSTGNNRPSGQRGIYAYWRVGADSVNDTGFVLLYNPST